MTKFDRPVKRLEAAAKSPVFSQIASSLQGLTTIRAFGAEGMLVKEFDRKVVITPQIVYKVTGYKVAL